MSWRGIVVGPESPGPVTQRVHRDMYYMICGMAPVYAIRLHGAFWLWPYLSGCLVSSLTLRFGFECLDLEFRAPVCGSSQFPGTAYTLCSLDVTR